MKKNLFLTFIFFFSTGVFAHGHWPQKIKAQYLLTEAYELKFNLSNHFENRVCFDIEVNSEIKPQYKQCLNSGQQKNMAVWVSSGIDKKMTNVVCSIARNKNSISTRMCTTATTMYPFSKLRGSE